MAGVRFEGESSAAGDCCWAVFEGGGNDSGLGSDAGVTTVMGVSWSATPGAQSRQDVLSDVSGSMPALVERQQAHDQNS